VTELLDKIARLQEEADLVHSQQAVQVALESLAKDIETSLAGSNPLVLCLMIGGLTATGWLLPRLSFPLQLDYIHATRYRGDLRGHDLEWHARPMIPVCDRTILLIDDIFDRGETLTQVADDCRMRGARQVFSAVLVRKQRAHSGMQPDFIGLEAPDRYLFGCGLDYKNYLRNLPAIYAVPRDFDKGSA
jgi:hypoxanthine phosphoribosyltransferase